MTIADLGHILKVALSEPKISVELPNSRLKDPYLEHLQELFPKAKSLKKIPVSGLRALLGAFVNDK